MPYYSHTKEGTPPEEWQGLEDHLRKVSQLMAEFAEPFNCAGWGEYIGYLHDIGKHSPAFQKRLTGENRRPADHKGAGARILKELETGFGLIGAYCVAGHHSGLPDFHREGKHKSLQEIVDNAAPLPDGVGNPFAGKPEPPFPFVHENYFQLSFLTRMLFSALVDADFLDTEAFMDAEKSSWRTQGPSLEELAVGLERKLASFTGTGRINRLRAEILAHCREKAALEPGLFTLTVPTGGGKTLTSMAFALDHALRHGKRRIVYVIPYTSIIEQNAQVFRDIFPANSVVEHHSNFDGKKSFSRENNASETAEEDTVSETAQERRHRLACENWDSPVVVTTNVQFFESLFANKPSKCRKLHNLAGAVIILDEAQMLPVNFLTPCLRALEALAANYGSSVVLCTATQPALSKRDVFPAGLAGLDESRELAPDPKRMHEAFRRTELNNLGELSLPEVADMVREREQVLCIVNTRGRAAELFDLVREEAGARHLSAVMCPAHRSKRLREIRDMLATGEPCRVITTQLVESGVDFSWPEVIREIAGLDSITQAAGRCNREGELDELAPVSVFIPTEGLHSSFSGPAAHTESVLRAEEGRDPFSPAAIHKFFELHYWLNGDLLDKKQIMGNLNSDEGEWYFRKAAGKFKLIDSVMQPVIIPWDTDAESLVDSLHYTEHNGGILRRLQQYTVQIKDKQFQALDDAGAIEWVAEAYAVLCKKSFYDDQVGLTFPGELRVGDFQA